MPYNWEGTPNSQLFPEKWTVSIAYLVLQFLGLSRKEWTSKTISSDSQKSVGPQNYIANKEVVNRHGSTTTAILPGLRMWGAGKNVHLPVFPWKGFDCILYKLLLEGWTLINTLLGADCDPTWTSNFSTFSLQLIPTIKAGHQHLSGRNFYMCLMPQLLQLLPEGEPLDHLALCQPSLLSWAP